MKQSCRIPACAGLISAPGSVSWDSDHVDIIEADTQNIESANDGATLFITEFTDLNAVCKALPAQSFTVFSAMVDYRLKNPVTISTDTKLEEIEAFLEAIDTNDDVHNVYLRLAG